MVPVKQKLSNPKQKATEQPQNSEKGSDVYFPKSLKRREPHAADSMKT